jgi:predicted phosphodiesterase
MNVAKYEFEGEYIDILPIGDLHLGSLESEYTEFLKVIDKYSRAKLIFLGDLIDNALAESIGDVYSQTDNPHKTLQELLQMFTKYKERILGVIGGNHERRTWRKAGTDPVGLICEQLGIPYADDLMVVDVSLKNDKALRGSRMRTNYAIAIHHGASGGRFPEKSIRQHRYFQSMVGGVDVYITGHTHVPQASLTAIYEYDARNKKISIRQMQHITIPAWTQEKYARQKILPPSPATILILRLYATKEKKHEVFLKSR